MTLQRFMMKILMVISWQRAMTQIPLDYITDIVRIKKNIPIRS